MKIKRQFWFIASFLFVVLAWHAGTVAAEDAGVSTKSTSLVSVERDDLPIICTAPHGGGDSVPGVPRRKGEGIQ